jgi:hypothetical protein
MTLLLRSDVPPDASATQAKFGAPSAIDPRSTNRASRNLGALADARHLVVDAWLNDNPPGEHP